MAAITAAQLLTAAKARYGTAALQNYIIGAAGDPTVADLQLTQIAASVLNRVQTACANVEMWPLPNKWPPGSVSYLDGSDCSSLVYTDLWPPDMWVHALGMILWRAMQGWQGISQDDRLVGTSHEQYFIDIEQQEQAIGVGGQTDTIEAIPMSARDRRGHNLLNDGAHRKIFFPDEMRDHGWDTLR